ncbi:MAG: hypothetical protein MUC76_00705 [Spirochaetes bacterium]|nr:hypothetical protein [Spirochaetota bacterium]
MNARKSSDRLLEALARYHNLLILIKGSPDPDVIASSFALMAVCDHIGLKSSIVALAEISHPQNRAIVKSLEIPLTIEKGAPSPHGYDAYAVLDFQSAYTKGVSEKLPCAVHIDHHAEEEDDVKADFRLVSDQAGAASTYMTLILRELDLPPRGSMRKAVATALLLGIQTDTDNLRHATKLDYEALQFLSMMVDERIVQKISNLPLSEDALRLISTAMSDHETYRDWFFAGLSFIDESKRDNIAIVADFLLVSGEAETVAVFAIIEKKSRGGLSLDVSFRTSNSDLDLNGLIKSITPNGGGRAYKGAYQVNLDYFASCPDRELLWKAVRLTTIETLKAARDNVRFIELRGFYRRMKGKIESILGG